MGTKVDETTSGPTTVLDLSDDLTARILVRLKPREIAAAALSCRRLASVCADDTRVWQPLCQSAWGSYTNPERWLQPGPRSCGEGSSSRQRHRQPKPAAADDDEEEEEHPPTSYRSVFATLRRLQSLMGLWRGAGDAPRGSLFRVGWAAGGEPHVEVVALRPTPARGNEAAAAVVEETTARVGAAFPGYVLKLVDESFAVLKDEPWKRGAVRASAGSSAGAAGGAGGSAGFGSGAGSGGGGGGSGRPSAAALAAAAVAAGGAGGCELFGASPPKSFGYEVLRFMEMHVAGSRSGSRKNRNRGGGGGAGGFPGPFGGGRQAVILKHLLRLQPPSPSRQRPLAGLWTGVYSVHGLEIISLGYEGRGSSGRIVATKVTGDVNVPAGEVTFRVHSEPLPQPWPLSEVQLITQRTTFIPQPGAAVEAIMAAAAAEAAAEAAGTQRPRRRPGVLALPVWAMADVAEVVDGALGEGDPNVETLQRQRLEELAAAAAEADPVDPWDYLQQQHNERVPHPPPTRVVAVYRGEGRVAFHDFSNPQWIDGRLWVYDNGSIGFLWRGRYNALVDLDRMSPQLLGRTGGPMAAAAATAAVGPV